MARANADRIHVRPWRHDRGSPSLAKVVCIRALGANSNGAPMAHGIGAGPAWPSAGPTRRTSGHTSDVSRCRRGARTRETRWTKHAVPAARRNFVLAGIYRPRTRSLLQPREQLERFHGRANEVHLPCVSRRGAIVRLGERPARVE